MKNQYSYIFNASFLALSLNFLNIISVNSQDIERQIVTYEDYAGEFLEENEVYLSTLEEWQNMIDLWLEKPLCINNEEADWLAEYKIISLYQLNKLKEYRFIYGNLLSVYELEFIDGWDYQTLRKVMPLVTVKLPKKPGSFKNFNFHSFRYNLVLKSTYSTGRSKGYQKISSEETGTADPFYTGSPVGLALRYDLEYRNKISLGIRMEKDPGEPWLIRDSSLIRNLKTPDLVSGYIHIKGIGPLQSLIIGNYKVAFGYGVNIAGGLSGIKGRNGMSGMAGRINPQTSVSESGFFRGAACSAGFGRVSVTGFASLIHIDGTSISIDTVTGKPLSFSSIDKSGIHRSAGELSGRKTISEKVFGGFIVYRNNWLKAGIITVYNQFDALISKSDRPYAKFGLSGRGNIIGGFSSTIWLPKLQFLNEISVSSNKSTAVLSGIQLNPVPGALVSVTYRNFPVDYQNWYGSGYVSGGRNSDESGLQIKLRLELPKKYLVEILMDDSRSKWISYDIAAPSRQREISIITEKAWPQTRSLRFNFRYLNSTVKEPEQSIWICKPVPVSQYKLRLESRIAATESISLKSRIECSLVQGFPAGWLILQDIEVIAERIRTKFWIRACFFDVMQYESRIYAYENDVQYDFSSFMHYGKGLRGILMIRQALAAWCDVWLRFSTIYYTNKNIGTGWDEIEGNRQNEIEIQLRLKWPD